MIRSVANSKLLSLLKARELSNITKNIAIRCLSAESKVAEDIKTPETTPETPVATPSKSKPAKSLNKVSDIDFSKDFSIKPNDLNKIYYYSDDFMKQHYPQGFNHDNNVEHSLTGAYSILFRKPIMDLLHNMDLYSNGYQGALPSFACITGPRGVGKTTALDTAYLYAKTNQWITWKVNARDITHNDIYILPMSRREGNFYAQPELSCTLLTNLYEENKDKLKNIPLRDTYEAKYFWEKSKLGQKINENSIHEMSLADLVQYGASNNRDSYEVLMYVRRELSQVLEYPVLICIDDYNYLHDISTFAYNNIKVHASSLYLGHIFRAFDEPLIPAKEPVIPPLRNGITLASTTEKHVPTYSFEELVNLQGHRISLQNMNKDEFNIYLDHLVKSKAFFRNGLHPQERQYLYSMTNGNFEQLLNFCKNDTTFVSTHPLSKKFLDYIERNNKQKDFSLWLEKNKYVPEPSTPSLQTPETTKESEVSSEEMKKKAKEDRLSEKEKEKRNQKLIEQKKKEYRKMKSKK